MDGSSFCSAPISSPSIRPEVQLPLRPPAHRAVRLFCTKLFQFVRDGALGIRPTHLAIIFDKSEDSFRKELYPAYKANRSEPPDDLIPHSR